jgi:hypothetical protein
MTISQLFDLLAAGYKHCSHIQTPILFIALMNEMVPGGFSGFRNRIASPALRAIADHWQQARAGKAMPGWSDLSPSALAAHLKQLWVFKYDRGSGDFTARLAGNRAMVRFGKSFRGTPLKELHAPSVFEQAQSHLTRIVAGPALARGTGKLYRIGELIVEGERIALPLAADGEHGDGILGASDFTPVPVPGSIELIYDQIEWFSF